MININDHIISNTVISSVMGHAGRGLFPLTLLPSYQRLLQMAWRARTVNFTKSSTYQRHKGNFRWCLPWTWKYVQRLDGDGLLNAYGLTNGGVGVNAPAIALSLKAGYNVIPSFYPQFAHGRSEAIKETLEAIALYSVCLGQGFWALELNFSCPNAQEKIRANVLDALACVAAVRFRHPNLCLIAKVSIVHPHEFAEKLVEAGVNVIHAINTIPFELVYPERRSPLSRVGGGGVSGGPAFSKALIYNSVLRQRIPNTPLIMGCGAVNLARVQQYFSIGADAVSLCTVCRRNPDEAIRIVNHYSM